MSLDRQSIKRQKKRSKRKKVLMLILLPLLVLTLSATAYGAFLFNKAESVMDKSYEPVERDTKRTDSMPESEDTSILFIGVDDSELRSYNTGSRSDALILATFNAEQKSVKLLSIPRDSYVYIPDVGYEDKITHAHAFGGVSATLETVEEMLDIPIEYYVKMNFNAFIDVVDTLGGIEAEVPYAISEMNSLDQKGSINLEPGIQELNGEEALALARTRKQDNDIERGKRQQEIIKAIVKKTISVSGMTKYGDLMEAVGDNMTTDLPFGEMKSFFDFATAGSSLNIDTLNLAGSDSYINSVYYYQLDETELENAKNILKAHMNLDNGETDLNSPESETEQIEGNETAGYE
ncbi:LCP family protein [Bacillus mesophilum]|uniref:LytR family transcriptional regulator n=1 Tax=Bacillus mesophilum TaxID=1071718 RepID=A0A7V7UV18_9BACI|nr:LCP family protein [Bacillus mesophilum]KAB2332657.1 LytR family transcriptional regulator [Bacillus mesophilum]